MPLLYKKPFVRNKPPSDIRPETKVFYCEQTNEVFTNYDDFWQRLVLLNALVWTCELTGKPNLTYTEAVESENKARKNAATVSPAIRKPFLYAVNLTKRTKIAELNEDVFNYLRDRYFVGENVDSIIAKQWHECKVTGVIMPTKEQIAEFEAEMASSDEESEDVKAVNGVSTSMSNGDDDEICIVRDDHCFPGDPLKITKEPAENQDFPPYGAVRYEVIEKEPINNKECKKHIVKWEQIRRAKSSLTREKCKVFLKQCVTSNSEGFLVVKDTLLKKYRINEINYSDIFVGKPPYFEQSKPRKSMNGSPAKKKEYKKKEPKTPNEPKPKKSKTSLDSSESKVPKKETKVDKEKMKEEIKAQLEIAKAEKKKVKEYKKEEKRLQSLFLNQHKEPIEDLLCGDQKDIPQGKVIQCKIPSEHFGDFMMLLQFINAYSETLELKDVYPHGISFDMLEHALVEREVAGILNDIIQLLIGAIFSLQKEEEEEIQEATAVKNEILELKSHLESKSLEAAISLANEAVNWIPQSQNISLQKAPIDVLTLTELLRVHLLASGSTNNTNNAWRLMNRGGFQSSDDPGLHFKIEEPEILEKLSTYSIFELSMSEKLKVLTTLVHQILTYASVRDTIDDKLTQVREQTIELRLLKTAEGKKEKEELSQKRQKVKEDKLKLLEKKSKEQEMKAQGLVNGTAQEVDENENEENEEDSRLKKEKENAQKERRKHDFDRKICAFLQKISSSTQDVHQLPLGEDRCFRKYWLFSSLPAFVVEDFDQFPGVCLDYPVHNNPGINPVEHEHLNNLIQAQARKNIEALPKEKEEKNASDKENDTKDSSSRPKTPDPNRKLLQETQGNVSSPQVFIKGGIPEDEKLSRAISDSVFLEELSREFNTMQKVAAHSPVFGLCSAKKDTCPVHSTHERPRWRLFTNLEDFQALLDCLNPRGERETNLKENLLQFKDVIENAIRDCPVPKLDPTQEPDLNAPERKSTRHNTVLGGLSSNLNFPPETPVKNIFELTLRDMVLEFEENLNSGLLGALSPDIGPLLLVSIKEQIPLPQTVVEDLDFGGRKRLNLIREELGLEQKKSEYKYDLNAYSPIEDLKIAVLLLGQAVEVKYLKDPLVESEKAQKKRLKAERKLRFLHKKEVKDEAVSSDEEEEDKSKATVSDHHLRMPMERWEKSLMKATSYSQISLHLATLDSSVIWSRSALKACCSKCRKKSDPEQMLLCDECNRGYHMYCLVPKLKSIPDGDWFCEKCKPKEKPKTPRKKRKMYCEISDDEEEDDEQVVSEVESEEENHEYCDACELSGELILCDTCPRSFHLDCAGLRKVPRGNWSCPLCKESNELQDERTPERRSNRRGTKRPLEEDSDDEYHKSQIELLLSEITSVEECAMFRQPVSRSENPDYYEKIKKPMDFRTIKQRMAKNKYTTDAEMIADVLLIFQNCQQYFKEKSKEYKTSVNLYKTFVKLVSDFKLNSGGHTLKPPAKKRR